MLLSVLIMKSCGTFSETRLNKPKGMTEPVVIKNVNGKKKLKVNLWQNIIMANLDGLTTEGARWLSG